MGVLWLLRYIIRALHIAAQCGNFSAVFSDPQNAALSSEYGLVLDKNPVAEEKKNLLIIYININKKPLFFKECTYLWLKDLEMEMIH